MSRILLEGGIIVLLVLMGISVFVPDNKNDVSNIIVDFENSIESGEVVDDGEIEGVTVNKDNNSNFIARVNCKISNIIVNGLNSIFDIGMRILRSIIN